MKKLKQILMAGVMASILIASTSGMAGGSTAGWVSMGLGAAATLASSLLAIYSELLVAIWWPNIDAAQLALEYMILDSIKNVKDDWDPEPADNYEKAAEANGGPGGTGGSDEVSCSSVIQTLPFQVAALHNVGIESIGVGPELGDIVAARDAIAEQLAWLQPKGSGTGDDTGAGSCGAPYSFCLRDMDSSEEAAVRSTQKLNEQDFGTAGITHATLGLRAVQQAIVNDGNSNSSVGKTGADISSDSVNVVLVGNQKPSVQSLSSLIGQENTVAAMKVVALMNLELAQRLNQGNMMQGASLTIEAARAFPEVENILK